MNDHQNNSPDLNPTQKNILDSQSLGLYMGCSASGTSKPSHRAQNRSRASKCMHCSRFGITCHRQLSTKL